MKFIVIFCLLSFNVLASNIGGSLVNKRTKDKLFLKCVTEECNEAVFVKNNEEVNTNLILDLNDRSNMFYHFHMITTTASTSRAPFPYTWYIMNMQAVTKKLRKSFPSMIEPSMKSYKVKMNSKNFLEVIKAIENY